LRAKLRKDQEQGRMGAGGPTHYFNYIRDGHFEASYTNPPFCYNCRNVGHRAMYCPAKKGLNMRICGFRMPGQGFYNIQVPEDEENGKEKTFPSLLTIK
jgi:hypothetical protein